MEKLNKDLLIKVVEIKIKQKELQIKRFKRFDKWLENNNFDNLLYRIILEIKSDEYSLYEMNNKLHFILEYIFYNYCPNIVPDISKTNKIYEFKNFYFEIYFGQGTVINIYNKDDKKCLISL